MGRKRSYSGAQVNELSREAIPDPEREERPGDFSANFREVSPQRHSIICIFCFVGTDGVDRGIVDIFYDITGDGTEDNILELRSVPGTSPGEGKGHTFTLPPGGQYKIENTQDPSGLNSVESVIETIL